ncbi:tetratricopeptide repeat-containing glycosyltransferase family 2 protein [Paenibacillus sp. FSL P4-0081]|uniref:tetratricopeptide repeat-containing glycosyltransferase family 2 protein n=1 Tax=Paenibacillus sp. FSL P4-0081 TaxID=1536769 RepID=UPI000693BC9B|nr:glycosyltransferase family 2 protein [Paenibacillus sp. FSL P4-0081]
MKKTPRKPLISLCMIVKNEADTLARCLQSVRGVADEIIIVDTGSTDSTVSIARSFGARIIPFPWNGDFASARNAGLAGARGTWILVLDADEELEPGSKKELLVCAEHTEYEAFFVRIHNHKGTDRASQTITVNPILRMFKSRASYRFSGIIHEQIAAVIVQETPAAAMHMSTVVVHHYGYADGVVEKKDKISRNIGLLKEQLKLNPGDAFHHFNMAVEYMRLGDYGHALEHIQTSLDHVEPDTSYIHLLYKYEIRCLAVTGDLPGALEACERGLALFPDYPDLHHIKGALLLQVSAFAEAKAALGRALDIGVSPPAYHTESGLGTYLTRTLLGQACQQIGEDNEAIACFTSAAQLHPEPLPLVTRLVRLFKCAGRELEIKGWLAEHLPVILADQRPELVRLLVRDGCYAAAADVLGGGVNKGAAGKRAAGEQVVREFRAGERAAGETVTRERVKGELAAEEQVVREFGEGELTAGETVARERVEEELAAGEVGANERSSGAHAEKGQDYAGEPEAASADSLLRLLQRAEAIPAAELTYGDIAALLQHPAIARTTGGTMSASESAASAVQPWISLADKVLATLEASSVFSPAAARARLALPLPRPAD